VGKRQSRKIGIDGESIYNLPPDIDPSSTMDLIIPQTVKRERRLLSDVVKAERLNTARPMKLFQILFRDLSSNAIVSYTYEAESELECAQIVAQISFLLSKPSSK
jgi:hypothetical protein